MIICLLLRRNNNRITVLFRINIVLNNNLVNTFAGEG